VGGPVRQAGARATRRNSRSAIVGRCLSPARVMRSDYVRHFGAHPATECRGFSVAPYSPLPLRCIEDRRTGSAAEESSVELSQSPRFHVGQICHNLESSRWAQTQQVRRVREASETGSSGGVAQRPRTPHPTSVDLKANLNSLRH
jgi:hypothetical protein